MLATKLHIPQPRREAVARPRLIARLDDGLNRTLILLSAPAGFGKTTLLGAWLSEQRMPVAWLALDEGESDGARFLTALVAAMRTVAPGVGAGVLGALQAPQPPPIEALLTSLINDLAALSDPLILALDDYHTCATPAVDQALTFLLDHLPPRIHLVIATREDPRLPLARLRVRDQLTELRAADLRFTTAEAAVFLHQVMGLTLAADDVAALEARTEGWIAGLQLAAISLRDEPDASRFIASFTGSHRFVLDFLLEEILQRQPAGIQTFLLRTSILDRLCGALCDAVTLAPTGSGQETLDQLERANLFLIPLDNERRWYRYHHLFGELLRQRLQQSGGVAPDDTRWETDALHARASAWYEAQGMDTEAFQQAAAAHDVDHAARLLEGNGMPLQFRGAIGPVLSWLGSLPKGDLDARPALWVMYASALSMTNQMQATEEKLQAAETALEGAEQDAETRNLIGHIAAIRAVLAATRNQVDDIISLSRRALDYLRPDNLPVRTATIWKLGIAYHIQGDHAAAAKAYHEAIALSEASGNQIIGLSAAAGLGLLQESNSQLAEAAETYQRILTLVGDAPLLVACEARFGLARISYEWNDLAAAERHCQWAIKVAPHLLATERGVACEIFLARLKLAQGDRAAAGDLLAQADSTARRLNLTAQGAAIADTQVRLSLSRGDLATALEWAQAHDDAPLIRSRVLLAQGDAAAALALLESWLAQMAANKWDERLKASALQAVALQAHGELDRARQTLLDALALAQLGGFMRTFLDEGQPMRRLLAALVAQGRRADYIGKLLAAFAAEPQADTAGATSSPPATQPLIEPLSPRERDVLQLIAQGLSNQEIGARLYLALDTVKGHNQRIFAKLQVQRRTEAVARARELGLL